MRVYDRILIVSCFVNPGTISYVSHKLGRVLRSRVLKYHTNTSNSLGDICEKQCSPHAEG